MNIEVICSFKNYILIKDWNTLYIWLYSYNKPIAYWDGKDEKKVNIVKSDLTQTNRKHISVFKKFIEN